MLWDVRGGRKQTRLHTGFARFEPRSRFLAEVDGTYLGTAFTEIPGTKLRIACYSDVHAEVTARYLGGVN